MNAHSRTATWMCGSLVLLMVSWAAAQSTQPAADNRPSTGGGNVGRVIGSNVYVRSGFSINYYPVTKLNQGDTVTIAGEEFGWLKIVPPQGTHSLIDKAFVDRVDDQTGTVNGETWVLAGSNIDNRRYAKQVKVSKGDRVRILGETSDNAMYKIQPPDGAYVWIKADLVDRGGTAVARNTQERPALETVKPGELEAGTDRTTPSGPLAATPQTPRPVRTAPQTRPADAPAARPSASNKYQPTITAIEAEVAAESAKDRMQQDYRPIIEKLRPLAEQTEDSTAKIYAEARIRQLQGYMDVIAALQEIRNLKEGAIATADQIAAEREKLRAAPRMPLDDIVVKGEIRVSSVYDGGGGRPSRWLVVDPKNGKSLAYIELPPGSPIDPVQYYGKYVGIRASGYRVLERTIPPMPVFTVQEITVLDPATQGGGTQSGAVMSASPAPMVVATPSSQPAGQR